MKELIWSHETTVPKKDGNANSQKQHIVHLDKVDLRPITKFHGRYHAVG